MNAFDHLLIYLCIFSVVLALVSQPLWILLPACDDTTFGFCLKKALP